MVSVVSGCGAATGTTCESLSFGGVTRTYLLHVPASFQRGSGALVIVLHGSGGNGLGMEVGTGFSDLADQMGFAVAYPDGLFEASGGQTNWAYFFNDFTDDVGFLRQLISTVQVGTQTNPKKVYVTGLSSGGLMSHRAGVQLSDVVAAIGSVEGALSDNLTGNLGSVVPPALGPVSVIVLHGDMDTTIRYCGAAGVASQEETFNYWAGSSANGCANNDTPVPLCDVNGSITSISEKDGTNCTGGREVKFYKMIGGIHTWYTTPMNVSGQVPFNPNFTSTTGVTTASVLWNFFAAHPKP
jgi:polyhydroxybutyrate depolymerase